MRRQNVSPSLPVVEEARPVDAVEQLDIESVGETPAEADGGESAEERMALYARVAKQAREEGMREAYPDFDPDDMRYSCFKYAATAEDIDIEIMFLNIPFLSTLLLSFLI